MVLTDQFLSSFAAIAATLFVVELTDKDAMLLLSLSTRMDQATVFAAGAVAFTATTTVNVTVGTALTDFVPLLWIRLAGGAAMLAVGLWEGGKLLGHGEREVPAPEARTDRWRTFLAIVGALALLDLAGDATEILTIVFVAQYSSLVLVFSGACTGLIAASALETSVGKVLGRVLTPRRVAYVSTGIPLLVGASIILLALF